MSLFDKFRLDPGEEHGGRLFHCDFTDPVPLRAHAPPLLTDQEADRLESVSEGYVRLFDVNVPQDRLDLQRIITRAYRGWYVVGHIQRHFLAEKATVMVYVEWYQLYNEVPKALEDRVFTDGGVHVPVGRPSSE